MPIGTAVIFWFCKRLSEKGENMLNITKNVINGKELEIVLEGRLDTVTSP